MKLTEKDLHLHSPLCPHRRTDEPLGDYLLAAEKKGLKELSFTEHSPLAAPADLIQYRRFPTEDNIRDYFALLRQQRDIYKGPVKFNIGLELDYLEGYEEKTMEYLSEFGPMLEDGLISVHNVRINGKFYFIATEELIPGAVEAAGGQAELLEIYYRTLIKSVEVDFGPYKPTRVGHPTLLHLCRKQFPLFETAKLDIVDDFVRIVKEKGYAMELNTQGLIKDQCRQIYGAPLLSYIKKYDVPMAIASDGHCPADIGYGFDDPDIVDNLDWLRPLWAR